MAEAPRAARPPPGPGRALLALGLLACLRAGPCRAPPLHPAALGEPVPLELEALSGAEFRLLPGVGPRLAERLEAARIAAGGRLDAAALDAVSGVGPVLRERWDALRARPAGEPPAGVPSSRTGALR